MFWKKKKMELLEQTQANLKQTQDNLDKTQQNILKYFEDKNTKSIEVQLQKATVEVEQKPIEVQLQKATVEVEQKPVEVLLRKAHDFIPEKSYEEKRKAAYALNLCTVSVSQIVEYDDIRTLDQEYNTILNNLNIQNMPKDDALLDILKQLLNVITFFKIQEGDKVMLEKAYQHKMKNAIWKSVPSVNVILAISDPKAVLFNLVTQIGTGYMNYRKEKSDIQLEQENQKWQLKRSAMEQINGLRRELFDAAWRLSKEYDFDDTLRLSERQIEQYNKILLDNIPERKYERLLSVKESFEAYPPFWYYLGHTATEIHKEAEAVESFYEFLRLTGYKTKNRQNVIDNGDLLREDHLCASCALELARLVSSDRNEMLRLLEIAVKVSGNASDVLQMCAMTYIALEENEKAIKVLRYLVNEGYNVDLNANLLGRLYFKQVLGNEEGAYQDYQELKGRTDSGIYMINIPKVIPSEEAKRNKIMEEYYDCYKKELVEKKEYVINQFAYKIKCNFCDLCIQSGNIAKEFAEFLQDFNNSVSALFREFNKKSDFKKEIMDKTADIKGLKEFATHDTNRTTEQINKVYETYILDGLVSALDKKLMDIILKSSDEEVFSASYALDMFCLENDLPVFVKTGGCSTPNYANEFLSAIYSEGEIKKVVEKETRKDACLAVIKKYKADVFLESTDGKMYFAEEGEPHFISYYKKYRTIFEDKLWDDDEIVAVLYDKTSNDKDLIFTTKGYILVGSAGIFGSSKKFVSCALYKDEIETSSRANTFKIEGHRYNNKYIDSDKLCEMIREIEKKTRNL